MGCPDLALAALHHDSHEAYTCDLPGPIKGLLRGYSEITDRLDVAIGGALGFTVPQGAEHQAIKAVDDEVFLIEATELLRDGPKSIPHREVAPEAAAAVHSVIETPLTIWDFGEAESRFTREHGRLAEQT